MEGYQQTSGQREMQLDQSCCLINVSVPVKVFLSSTSEIRSLQMCSGPRPPVYTASRFLRDNLFRLLKHVLYNLLNLLLLLGIHV